MTGQAGKRIEARELRCQERQRLEDVIPLATPFVVYIEPTNRCNFRCKFCPTGDPALLREVGRANASLSLELYRKILAGLREFPGQLKLLSLYKDGEPLLNRHFPEMVRLAREAGVAERIWTKTNGSLLKPELNRRLVDAGLDMICISVEEVSAAGYLEISGVKIDYDAFRDNIADLFHHRGRCEVYIKIADAGLPQEKREKFFADFQPISTHISVERLMGWSNSGLKDFTLGTNPDTYDGLPLVPKEVCAYPFYVLAVNADGTVSLCGNDWSHQTVVGDVNRESLWEIWHGEALFRFRKMLLEGRRRENKACGDCYYLKIVPDNIDSAREEILARLERVREGQGRAGNRRAMMGGREASGKGGQ